jgi:hypothetical protein
MRSDRVHKALVNIQNRFMLCRLVSVATRKYHDPDMRVQNVINDVIGWFADAEFATQQLRILADLEPKRGGPLIFADPAIRRGVSSPTQERRTE